MARGTPAVWDSPHDRSHGESLLALLRHRFGPRALYLLDEPETVTLTRSFLDDPHTHLRHVGLGTGPTG